MNRAAPIVARRDRIRGHLSVFLVVIAALLAASACSSPGFVLTETSEAPLIVEKEVHFEALEGTSDVMGYDLQFDGEVERAEYDHAEEILFVRYKPEESNTSRVVFYDVNARRPVWSGEGNAVLEGVHERLAVMAGGGERKIVDIDSGAILREAENGIFVLADGRVVTISASVRRIDWQTGEVLWSRGASSAAGFSNTVQLGDTLLLVRDGLHAIDLETGEGWYHEASTSSKAIGKAIAKNLLWSVVDVMTNSYSSWEEAEVTHNMTSLPMRIGDLIYFAARDRLIALDAATGSLVWETEIGEEPGSMDLYALDDERLVLVGTGTKWVDGSREPGAPPSVGFYDAETGQLQGRFAMTETDAVIDVGIREGSMLLLTPQVAIQFDDQLRERARIDAIDEFGSFVAVDVTGDALLIRTVKGLWAVDPETLSERWFTDLGSFRYTERSGLKSWGRPIRIHRYEAARRWRGDDYLWTPGIDGLRRVDTRSGRTDLVVDGLGDRFEVRDDVAVGYEGSRVRLVNLAMQPRASSQTPTFPTIDREGRGQ